MQPAVSSEYKSPEELLNEALSKPPESQGIGVREQVAMSAFNTLLEDHIAGNNTTPDILRQLAVTAVDAADILIHRLATSRGKNV